MKVVSKPTDTTIHLHCHRNSEFRGHPKIKSAITLAIASQFRSAELPEMISQKASSLSSQARNTAPCDCLSTPREKMKARGRQGTNNPAEASHSFMRGRVSE